MKNMKTLRGSASLLATGLAVALFALVLPACSDDSGNNPPIETKKSYIRVLHLSPDAPGVDVFVNGETRAVTDLMFDQGTDYLEVDEGTYSFNIVPTGGMVSDSVLDVENIRLSGDRYYTAIAFGELGNIRAMALEDDLSGLADDMIRVRAIHAAAAVGQVDIWNIPEMGQPGLLYENVEFGVAGGYLDLPAGAYTLGFDLDDDASPDVIFSLPALAGGTIANVFATNDASGTVFLSAQFSDSSQARIDVTPIELGDTQIRVLHLSPDAPAVDIWVNGTIEAFSDLGFGQGSDYATLEEGTYDIAVAPAGTSAAQSVLDIQGLDLMADTRYTAVAYDNLGSIRALALVDDYDNLNMGDIRVRPIHTAVGVGQVDIWNLPEMGEPALLYEDVDFGSAGNYIDLPAGAYTLGFDVDNDMVPDVIFEIPALPEGTVANVFAVTDDQGTLSLKGQLNGGQIAPIAQAIGQVRAIHLSPDAPAVDILYNDLDAAVVSGLEFGQGTGYLDLLPGSYDFHITPEGGTRLDAVLHLHDLGLMNMTKYTAVAFDQVSGLKGLWLHDDEDMLGADMIRVRAVHTAPAVGQVDIWALFESADPVLLYENVNFGVAGGQIDLPADAYTLGFDVNDDMVPDVIFDLPALPAGTVANVFAVNDLGGSVFLLAQLQDGAVARVDLR